MSSSVLPLEDPMQSWWPYIVATMVALISVIRSFMGGKEYKNSKRMDSKVVVITGANSGIGFQTAMDMAARGATVVMACRNTVAAEKSANIIKRKHPKAILDVRKLDVSSLKSVTDFVHELPYNTVHILINNAAVVFQPFELTEEGFEKHFATNYLGHFLLTRLLVPRMFSTPDARIINMTAQAHFAADVCLNDINLKTNFTPLKAFGQSKLCLLLITRYLGHKLKDTSVTFIAVNPGLVRGTKHVSSSPVFQKSLVVRIAMLPIMWLLMKNAKQGAQTVICAALDSQLEEASGAYMSDCRICEPSPKAKDEKLAAALFEKSLLLVGAKSQT